MPPHSPMQARTPPLAARPGSHLPPRPQPPEGPSFSWAVEARAAGPFRAAAGRGSPASALCSMGWEAGVAAQPQQPELTVRPVRFFATSHHWIIYEQGSPTVRFWGEQPVLAARRAHWCLKRTKSASKHTSRRHIACSRRSLNQLAISRIVPRGTIQLTPLTLLNEGVRRRHGRRHRRDTPAARARCSARGSASRPHGPGHHGPHCPGSG